MPPAAIMKAMHAPSRAITKNQMRFQLLTATSMKMTVFSDIAPCDLVDIVRRFGGAYCLHPQDSMIIKLMMDAASTSES
jgi:hypothetical protein